MLCGEAEHHKRELIKEGYALFLGSGEVALVANFSCCHRQTPLAHAAVVVVWPPLGLHHHLLSAPYADDQDDRPYFKGPSPAYAALLHCSPLIKGSPSRTAKQQLDQSFAFRTRFSAPVFSPPVTPRLVGTSAFQLVFSPPGPPGRLRHSYFIKQRPQLCVRLALLHTSIFHQPNHPLH